jgi:hypothetical protein
LRLVTQAPYWRPLVLSRPGRIVSRSSTVIARFVGSFARAGKYVAIGVRTPGMSPRSMAMPTSADTTLFDADFTLAGRSGRAPL